jgi:hypothetical protein
MLLVEKHNGAKRSGRETLYRSGKSIQDLVQRRSLRHQFQHSPLFFDDKRGVVEVFALAYALGQAPPRPEPTGGGTNPSGEEQSDRYEFKPHGARTPILPFDCRASPKTRN